MKNNKFILQIILCLVILFSILPISVSADDNENILVCNSDISSEKLDLFRGAAFLDTDRLDNLKCVSLENTEFSTSDFLMLYYPNEKKSIEIMAPYRTDDTYIYNRILKYLPIKGSIILLLEDKYSEDDLSNFLLMVMNKAGIISDNILSLQNAELLVSDTLKSAVDGMNNSEVLKYTKVYLEKIKMDFLSSLKGDGEDKKPTFSFDFEDYKKFLDGNIKHESFNSQDIISLLKGNNDFVDALKKYTSSISNLGLPDLSLLSSYLDSFKDSLAKLAEELGITDDSLREDNIWDKLKGVFTGK